MFFLKKIRKYELFYLSLSIIKNNKFYEIYR